MSIFPWGGRKGDERVGMQWAVKNNSPSQYALQNLQEKRSVETTATRTSKAKDETHHQVSSRNAL